MTQVLGVWEVSLNLGSATYFTAPGLVVICMLGLILSEIPGIYYIINGSGSLSCFSYIPLSCH